MLRLNCFLEISDSSLRQKAIDAAVELVELSFTMKAASLTRHSQASHPTII